LNYGATVPFFTNGIFEYKKEWGMYVEEVPDQLFCALKIVSLNEKSLSFLLHNPFIFLDKNTIKGLIFVDNRLSKAELQNLSSTYTFPKMHSLIVISFCDRKAGEPNKTTFSSSSQNTPVVLGKALLSTCSAFLERGLDLELIGIERNELHYVGIKVSV
jgi:hypothetical protein